MAQDGFGDSVSVSGGTAVVGAFLHKVGSVCQGTAYVFVQSGATWNQQAELAGGDVAGCELEEFGSSVAVSGGTIVVGAPGYQVGGSNAAGGAVYVFVQSGATWTQEAEIVASGAADDSFGLAAATGGTVVVGATFQQVGNNVKQGAAYVFAFDPPDCSTQPDGAACDDGDACTQTAACQAGVCVGGGPVVCAPLDECHVAGTCDPVTGCSNPAQPDGTACSAGTCEGGTCVAATGGTSSSSSSSSASSGSASSSTSSSGSSTSSNSSSTSTTGGAGGGAPSTSSTGGAGGSGGAGAGSGDGGSSCDCGVAGETPSAPRAVLAGIALAALALARRRRCRASSRGGTLTWSS